MIDFGILIRRDMVAKQYAEMYKSEEALRVSSVCIQPKIGEGGVQALNPNELTSQKSSLPIRAS